MRLTLCTAMMALAAPLLTAQKSEAEGLFKDLQLATTAMRSGDFATAERILKAIVQDAPDYSSAWYQLALCLHLQKKGPEAGICVQQAILHKQDFVEAKVLGAEVFATLDQPKAVEYALEVGKTSSDSNHLRKVLEVLVSLRETDKALPILDRVIAESPKDVKLLDLKARWGLTAKKPAIAEQAYAAIVTLQPNNPQALESLGRVQLHQGKHATALKTFERTLAANPSNVRVRKQAIELMKQLERDPQDILVQQRYLEYYRYWIAKRAEREQGARTAGPGK